MAEEAIKKGFSELCFTDHYDISNTLLPGFENYVFKEKLMWDEYEKAVSRFEGKLKIKLGIEIGMPHHFPEKSELFFEGTDFDFIICSLHSLHKGTDYYFMDFTNLDIDKIFNDYFEDLYVMADYDNYDVLGHLPYPMRYVARTFGKCDITPYYDIMKKIMKRAIEKGKGIEINTSTMRNGLGFSMPPLDIAVMFKELGGEYITIGSDAHAPDQLGFGIADVRKELFERGIKYLTVYEKRKPKQIAMF